MMLFRILVVIDGLVFGLLLLSALQSLAPGGGLMVSAPGQAPVPMEVPGMPAFWLASLAIPGGILALGIWLQRRGRLWLANLVLGVMVLPILATAGFAALFIIAGALRG